MRFSLLSTLAGSALAAQPSFLFILGYDRNRYST
jgi:hypothetical protein